MREAVLRQLHSRNRRPSPVSESRNNVPGHHTYLTASAKAESVNVTISAEADSPEDARAIANAAMKATAARAQEVEGGKDQAGWCSPAASRCCWW